LHPVALFPLTLAQEFGGGHPPMATGIPGIPSIIAVALTATGRVFGAELLPNIFNSGVKKAVRP
jgi:hypothetical protein